jgi:outer membrane protein assembly factor BamB
MYRARFAAALVVLLIATLSCGKEPATPQASDSQALKPSSSPGGGADWPQWRGPNRDGRSAETGLLPAWPAEGPTLLWTSRELGRGYSCPSIVGNRIYTLGSDGSSAVALCLDLADGRTLWTTPIGEEYQNNWGGGPRSSPTIDGDRMYALGAAGDLACLNCESGEVLWSKSLVKDFGGNVPGWGFCESPLVDGDKVVVTPGGANCLVALDKLTGETIWTSTGLNDAAQYASIVAALVDGVPIHMTMTSGGLVGVAAETGKFLWRFDKTRNGTAVIPTPIYHDGHVYSTSGYGAGCGLVKLAAAGDGVTAEEVWFNRDMKNQHGGVVLVDGRVYGYSDGGGWLCQDFLTGAEVWRDRSELGKGAIAYADGHLYCYTEGEGTIALIEAGADGWKQTGRFDIPERTQLPRGAGAIWTHPVIARGKLFLRDQELLFCYDIAAK